jgi:hypothetical protein
MLTVYKLSNKKSKPTGSFVKRGPYSHKTSKLPFDCTIGIATTAEMHQQFLSCIKNILSSPSFVQ